MSGETVRLEEFTGVIQNKVVAVWQTADSVNPWLPTEFLLTQYITRILVVGRTAQTSVTLAADSGWTQVWRSPGAKEWSCLLGILQHMPGPVLIVVGPDVALTPKILSGVPGSATTVVVRVPGMAAWPSVSETQVFFPVLGAGTGSLTPVIQEWAGRAVPRSLDFKTLVPQLVSQGYGLTVAEGVWHWYRPADSPPFASLTMTQVAKQLQILGSMLEKLVV